MKNKLQKKPYSTTFGVDPNKAAKNIYKQTAACKKLRFVFLKSRGEWIRTTGLYVPNVALYQAKLRLEFLNVKLYLCCNAKNIQEKFFDL